MVIVFIHTKAKLLLICFFLYLKRTSDQNLIWIHFPFQVNFSSGIIFAGGGDWFTSPIEMERKIALPIHRPSFLERVRCFGLLLLFLPWLLWQLFLRTDPGSAWLEIFSCRSEKFGGLLSAFWQLQNKLLPMRSVAQHPPAAFGKLNRSFLRLGRL